MNTYDAALQLFEEGGTLEDATSDIYAAWDDYQDALEEDG